jgi:hypothetical protein
MKRATLMLVLAGAVFALGAGTASARTSYPTEITHDSSVALSGGQTLVGGQVKSPYRLCSVLRGVKLIGHYPDGSTELLDADLSSIGGAWGAKADLTGADRVKAVALRSAFRVHHRRKVCERAAVVWALA